MPMGDDKVRIFRAPRDAQNPYFMMRRDTAQDETISYEARGMLAYLLSKPGDWELRRGDLMRAGSCGRDRVIRILKELVERGYAQRLGQRRDDDHKFVGVDYAIYEKPCTENPSPGKPYTENPLQQSNESDKKQSPQTKGNGEDRPNIFRFWEHETGTMLTQGLVERLKEAVAKYGEEWLRDAITVAVDNNARSWSYVRTVLERWQRDGKDFPVPQQTAADPEAPPSPAAARPRSAKQQANDRVFDAVKALFHLDTAAGALVGRYVALMTGTTPETAKRGKKTVYNGDWFEYQVQPGMSADEIEAFSDFIDDMILAEPQRINHWVSRFRSDPEHDALVQATRRKRQYLVMPETTAESEAIGDRDELTPAQLAEAERVMSMLNQNMKGKHK